MLVRIIEIIRLKICLQHPIQNEDQLVEGPRLTTAKVVNTARLRIEGANRSIDHILHINKIAALFSVFEDPWTLAGAHLL